MATAQIKMTYIAAQYRVRVQFTKADCMAHPAPPAYLLERAKNKLRAERDQGHIAFYRIFKTRLEKTWELLRGADEEPDTLVAVTLATGAPMLPGVTVRLSETDSHLADLSITAPPHVVEGWGFKTFKQYVGKQLLLLDVTGVPDSAHLHSAWIRASRGETVVDYAILKLAVPANKAAHHAPYELIANTKLGEIKLVIHDIRAIFDQDLTAQIGTALLAAAKRVSQASGQAYMVRSNAIMRELNSANRGPERFGVDLPVVHLAAIAKHAVAATTKTAENSSHSLASFVTVLVAPDAMNATVQEHQASLHKLAAAKDPAAWSAYLHSLGIINGITQSFIADAIERVTAGKSLAGLVVALGQQPIAGMDPYVFETYRHASTEAKSLTNVRESQQRAAVRKGQVIAEFRFKTVPVDGCDVLGRPIPAAAASNLPVLQTGEGVQRSGLYTFIAVYDGIPEIIEGNISLKKAWVIPGSVNLATGNIHFTGQVEVKGSIETGAVVEVTGDLVVHGLIQGGSVKVSGMLTVMGGIMTNQSGIVRVGGDLTAMFIENSHIYCKGQITVKKSVMSSHIFCEKGLVVEDPAGLIAGGDVNCATTVTCANLGRSSGTTIVRVGLPPKYQFFVAIRTQRLAKLEHLRSEEQAMLKSLNKRRSEQMTTHHTERQTELIERAEHCAALITRLKDSLDDAKRLLNVSLDASVMVYQTLAMSTRIEICGQHIPLASDINGVSVHGTALNGSNLRILSAGAA